MGKSLNKYRHWLLKFNYAVEIGAHQAYLGHYGVTKDLQIKKIANEELEHRQFVEKVLIENGQTTFWLFNLLFTLVGYTIRMLCYISPKILLNYVAIVMEKFAIFNYEIVADLYPQHKVKFLEMAMAELNHELYFKCLNQPKTFTLKRPGKYEFKNGIFQYIGKEK